MVSKLKNLFKKKEKLIGGISNKILYMNNHVDIIHDACKICYNKEKEKTREDKLYYIKKRVQTGHDSILEHSNIVTEYTMRKNETQLEALAELLEVCNYVKPKIKMDEEFIHLTIGGSIRGYKHIIKNIINQDNILAKAIINSLYLTNKEYFTDFIEDNIMSEYKFKDIELTYPAILTNHKLSDNIEIVNMDDISFLQANSNYFYENLLDLCTITILFKDISRIISQQITRHRNGITQLSQRYVDYSSESFKFNSPVNYKPDKYDKDHIYSINFNGTNNNLTLQQLGDEMMKIYNQLVNKDLEEYRLVPEDARGYLPNNAQTSLYMTFTFTNLIKFLQLRTDIHAQSEIRILAQTIEDTVKPILENILQKDMYSILEPKYKSLSQDIDYYKDIDEIIEE